MKKNKPDYARDRKYYAVLFFLIWIWLMALSYVVFSNLQYATDDSCFYDWDVRYECRLTGNTLEPITLDYGKYWKCGEEWYVKAC